MNKKRSLKPFKVVMIMLLAILATSATFLFSKDVYSKRTNTLVENNVVKITQPIPNVSPMPIKTKEKPVQLNQNSLKSENKTEKTNIDIKLNDKRLGEKTKSNVNQWKNGISELSKKYPDKVILKGKGNKKIVALTFDDGPDRNVTPKIIDVLNEYNVKGTFFFQGDKIQNNEDIVRKAFKYGNQIAGHSFSHPMFTKISKEQIIRELTKTNNLINSCIGKIPVYFRPPYGDIDENTLKYLEDNSNAIIWSLDTFDWVKGTTAAEIAKFVVDYIEPEDIILMHSNNGKQETLKAVPLIIKGLKDKGYEFVTVSEMLKKNAYE